MKLVDANVLLYAVNESDPKHATARTWLDSALSGDETIGFAWAVLLAFLRLSTKIGLFPNPLSAEQALTTVRSWLDQPPSLVVEPTPRHLDRLAELLEKTGAGGNLTTDGHLAALSIENNAEIVSFDTDFRRFPKVRWAEPE